MKLVFPLFVIASAAAHFEELDEGLDEGVALIQLRSVASRHTAAQSPAGAEAQEAQSEAGEAVKVARQALTEAEKAERDANDAKAKAQPLPAAPEMEDEAAATGDPHLTQANRGHKDLCCTGSVCKACTSALVQQKRGGGGGRGTTPAVEEAQEAGEEAKGAASLAREALSEAQKAQSDANKAAADAEQEEKENDQAAASGDPHLTLADGAHQELCCSGSVCKACPYPALVQQKEDVEEIKKGKRTKHRGRGKTPAVEEAKEAEKEAKGALSKAREALREAREAESDANKASQDADKEAESDQAAAVGDPHMTLPNGNKEDLCCHHGHCKAC